MDRWNKNVDGLVRVGVVEPVHLGEFPGGRLRFRGLTQDETRPSERRRVGRVLLVASLQQHHSRVERERGEDEQPDDPEGKEDQDLTTLGTTTAEAAS